MADKGLDVLVLCDTEVKGRREEFFGRIKRCEDMDEEKVIRKRGVMIHIKEELRTLSLRLLLVKLKMETEKGVFYCLRSREGGAGGGQI